MKKIVLAILLLGMVWAQSKKYQDLIVLLDGTQIKCELINVHSSEFEIKYAVNKIKKIRSSSVKKLVLDEKREVFNHIDGYLVFKNSIKAILENRNPERKDLFPERIKRKKLGIGISYSGFYGQPELTIYRKKMKFENSFGPVNIHVDYKLNEKIDLFGKISYAKLNVSNEYYKSVTINDKEVSILNSAKTLDVNDFAIELGAKYYVMQNETNWNIFISGSIQKHFTTAKLVDRIPVEVSSFQTDVEFAEKISGGFDLKAGFGLMKLFNDTFSINLGTVMFIRNINEQSGSAIVDEMHFDFEMSLGFNYYLF